jgi:hypothetical protein
MLELRPEVLAFAQHMEIMLRKNEHKGGWKDCELSFHKLYTSLEAEIHELQAALLMNRPGAILDEMIDVANRGMMLLDHLGLLMVDLTDLDGVKAHVLKVLGETTHGLPDVMVYHRGMYSIMTDPESKIGERLRDGRIVTMPGREDFQEALKELEAAKMVKKAPGTETYVLVDEEDMRPGMSAPAAKCAIVRFLQNQGGCVPIQRIMRHMAPTLHGQGTKDVLDILEKEGSIQREPGTAMYHLIHHVPVENEEEEDGV